MVADGDTLFYLFTKRGGYTPQQRAQMTGAAIEELGRRFNLRPDSVSIDHSDIVSDLMYGNKVLLSLTDQDALWEAFPVILLRRKDNKTLSPNCTI